VTGNNSPSFSAILPPRSAKEKERAKETERVLAIFHQWGIHTVGQLAKLNRDDLAVRLGARAIELWDRAHGGTARLLKLVSPPESFVESFEFENEIETSEPLLFMLRRFLQQLATRLNAIYLVAKELRFRIIFSDKSHYERVFKIPQPTNNEEILFRMLHTHLENFTSKHSITAVELEARPSRLVRQQFSLFEAALRDPTQLYETLARLVGLLGAERVGRPVPEETHRPDAFRMEPFVWDISTNANETRSHPSLFLRAREACDSTAVREKIPLRRFRKRANAIVLLENNQLVHLRAAEIEGVTIDHEGPFPLSGNWWDEKAWAQVEWDVELENGVIARCHCDKEGWAVDGVYD
jgi:protein ImuB